MITVYPNNTLTAGGKIYRCALGKGGIVAEAEKREGDGATPAGIYPLRSLYYRADKMDRPRTHLPAIAIQRDDGWCDDPADPQYNRLVKLPYAARHEKLWREDDVYDLIVVLGHNDDPVAPGHGSCIFMHIAKPDYSSTEGCIALNKADLLEILANCDQNTQIAIMAG